jgi:hypothetical protein
MILSNLNLSEIRMATKKTKGATQAPAPAVNATAEEPTITTVEPVQLTIADLQLLARIVDLASRRGAFQAGELSQVGDAYNKLAGFLAYVESTQKSEEAAKEESAA